MHLIALDTPGDANFAFELGLVLNQTGHQGEMGAGTFAHDGETFGIDTEPLGMMAQIANRRLTVVQLGWEPTLPAQPIGDARHSIAGIKQGIENLHAGENWVVDMGMPRHPGTAMNENDEGMRSVAGRDRDIQKQWAKTCRCRKEELGPGLAPLFVDRPCIEQMVED